MIAILSHQGLIARLKTIMKPDGREGLIQRIPIGSFPGRASLSHSTIRTTRRSQIVCSGSVGAPTVMMELFERRVPNAPLSLWRRL